MRTSSWIMGILGLGIGFVLGWFVFGGVGVPTQEVPLEDETETADEVTGEEVSGENGGSGETYVGESLEGAIIVSDQPAGSAVQISSLTLQNSGWVAVREDLGGSPGNILGAGWFTGGQSGPAEVRLLRGTVPGGLYYIEYRSDDGDRDFDHKKDVALPDENGDILSVSFRTDPLDVGF